VLEESTFAQVEVRELLDDVVLLFLELLDQILREGGGEGVREGREGMGREEAGESVEHGQTG